MQGKMVDIEKLRAANENTRAVGNMNVNARGDIVGPGNTIVRSKEDVMKEYYEAPTGAVADTPPPKAIAPIPQEKVVETKVMNPTPTPVQVKQETKLKKIDTFKPKTVVKKEEATPSGIDAALDGLDD